MSRDGSNVPSKQRVVGSNPAGRTAGRTAGRAMPGAPRFMTPDRGFVPLPCQMLSLSCRAQRGHVRRPHRQACAVHGKPAVISDDYFDEKIVRGTELAEPEDTTREDILKEAGYEQVYDIDEIITRMPSPAEIARLGILPERRLPSTSGPATPPKTSQSA
jgi:hypothetical protein